MADLRQQQQSQQSAGGKKKKSSGGIGVLVVFIIWFVLPRVLNAMENPDLSRAFQRFWMRLRFQALELGIDPAILPFVIIVVVIVLISLISAVTRKAAVSAKENNSTAGRTSAAKHRPDPRTRSFVPPEPSCIVCDHTGEDHFVRDKAQRIAQLDEWLKNGLIDREEYRVLKDRYQRDL